MRVKDKEDIIRIIRNVQPDDFDGIKIISGNKHKIIGSWSKHPSDDISGFLFELSLSRRITSILITDGGLNYPSYLRIGTSSFIGETTNIDADVIEEICLAFKRRMDANFPNTKQYIKAEKEAETEKAKDAPKSWTVTDFEKTLFGDDIGMP